MENDPSPTQPNDELEFTELTGINDYDLDQKLRLPGRIQNLREDSDIIGVSEIVLMLLAQQLPAQLEYRSNSTSELKDAAYERLLDEGGHSVKRVLQITSPKYATCYRHLELTNSLQRDVAKKSSRAGSTQCAC